MGMALWGIGLALLMAQGAADDRAGGVEAAEAGWLRSVPADVDLVVRTRGIGTARDDLLAMLRATSPDLADMALPFLLGGPAMLSEQFGSETTSGPLLIVARLPKPGALGTPPYAVFVRSEDPATTRRNLAGPGGEPTPKPQDGGVESIKGSDGLPIFTTARDGFLAFGNDEFLLGAIVKPEELLESRLTADLKARLLEGDVGLFVDLVALRGRYRDEIDSMRKSLESKQAGESAPGGRPSTGMLNGAIADAIEDGESLALSFDFQPDALTLAGEVVARPGSATAKLLEVTAPVAAEALGRLPGGLTNYLFLRSGREAMAMLQGSGLANALGQGGEPPEAVRKAVEQFEPAGLREMAVGSSVAEGGIRGLTLATYDNPARAVGAFTALYQALRADRSARLRGIKAVEVEPKARVHGGFELTRVTIAWDLNQIARIRPEVQNAAAVVRAALGEAMSTWYGTDGRSVLSVVAPNWETAARLIDASNSGRGSLRETPAYQSLRDRLPAEANGLLLVHAQGFVRQFHTQLAGMLPNDPNLKPIDDLPGDPVLLGAGYTATPAGIHFRSVIPVGVGPIFEKGLLPHFRGLAGRPAP